MYMSWITYDKTRMILRQPEDINLKSPSRTAVWHCSMTSVICSTSFGFSFCGSVCGSADEEGFDEGGLSDRAGAIDAGTKRKSDQRKSEDDQRAKDLRRNPGYRGLTYIHWTWDRF